MNCLKNISLEIINNHFSEADNVPKFWVLILMNILILTNIFRWSLQHALPSNFVGRRFAMDIDLKRDKPLQLVG